MQAQYVSIGYIKKPHGVKGEVRVTIADEYWEDFLQTPVIFLRIKGKPVPYFVEEVRPGNLMLVKFEQVSSLTQALELSSCEILLKNTDVLPRSTADNLSKQGLGFNHCQGYELIDVEKGAVGIISEILDLPQQEMAIVEYKGKELMIPLHDQLVEKLDGKNKKLLLRLPDGLLDL
jgi:16S rRNA processing protein RimM